MKDDMLLWDETLFKDPEVFELDYVPEHFDHREAQMKSLRFCVRPAIRGARPVNALCLGPPGTGKTTAIIKLFEEIEKHTRSVITVHINCQIDGTRYSIFSRIYKKIFGVAPPSSGISFKRLFDKIANELASREAVLIVALDDVSYLFPEKEIDQILYTLLRSHESLPGFRAGVMAAHSEPSMKYILDPRVESVFRPEEILFPPYKRDEIFAILSRRAQLGFYPGVLSQDVLDLVVDLTTESGDLRVGIDLLKRAGMEAERRASRSISEEDVRRAFSSSRFLHIEHAIRSLSGDERTLLRIIAEQPGGKAQSGELYRTYHGITQAGYTKFYEILKRLEALRLVETSFTGPGMRGRSRIIRLRCDPAEVITRVKE
ncbi:MAG TPA: ORC1-type DNA replication protein [Methanothrix sp.]|nr:ORC1-type DNA replication protein [Methanothrix sp.]HOK57644.1 ORC1-type DNA replication protein [Methanothrix sp.]HOL42820.1 ORC1-type DNA replication protein [Methanothrix sp.]HPO87928.1 ORC1-type DNA replication protein [Methanothrix sp.]